MLYSNFCIRLTQNDIYSLASFIMDSEVRAFQDIAKGKCDTNLKLVENLETLKIDLKNAKINLNIAKENTEQKRLENLNLQKQIITLDDVIPMKKKLVEDLTQEYVNLCATVDDTRCRQFRARVVSSHEAANRNKYLSSMEECKMTVDLTAGAKAEQLRDLSRRKSGLETKIRSLLDELQQKQKQAEDKEKELEGLQQKIFMLKKRNEARLVRLKKQVEKAEARQQTLLKHQHVNK